MIYFIISLLMAVISFGVGYLFNTEKERLVINVIFSIFLGFLTWFLLWFCCFVIAFNFTGWMWLIAVILTIRILFAGIVDEYDYNYKALFSLLIIVILIVIEIFSSRAFRHKEFRGKLMVKKVPYENLVKDLSPLDISKMIIVDNNEAKIIAELTLSDIPGLGSRCKIGEISGSKITGSFTITDGKGVKHDLSFDNDLVWVAPLEFIGYWRYSDFKTTDGFVMVSAYDSNVRYLVTEVNGVKMNLKYLKDGYFEFNLERHLRNNGYLNAGLTAFSFELDDQGSPKYVVTEYDNVIGVSGEEATGTLIVDPLTGDIVESDVKNTPLWVENIQPIDFVKSQIDDWGELIHGWINKSNRDIITTTNGIDIVMSGNSTNYYTCMQSSGADESSSGFMLVNTRDKSAILYEISGINEFGIMKAFGNHIKVKNKNYSVTFPKPYKVRGVPAYFATYKGDDGKVAMYGFCDFKDTKIMGVGETIIEAMNDYQKSSILQAQKLNLDSDVKLETLEIIVSEVISENDNYFIIPVGNKSIELYGSSKALKELKWARKGDKANVIYNLGKKETSAALSYFDLVRLDL